MKGIVGKLTQGAADAGFVYVTDVNATGGELKAIDAARRARARRDLRRGRGERGRASPSSPRRSSTGSPRATAPTALERGGLRSGAVRQARLVRAPARALPGGGAGLPDAADRRDLRRLEPGRPDREPGRGGGARRALAEPAHHGDLDRDHPAGGHAGGVPAGHALVPRQGARGDADRAPAGAAAGGGGHRAAGGRGARGDPRRSGGGGRHRALARHRRGGRGADLRGLAVLRPPGDGGVRRGRPHAARRVAHAGRVRGARLPARDDPGGASRGWPRARRSRSAARWESSAPR